MLLFVKTTVVWEGEDKLVEIQTWDGGKRQTKIEWLMEGDEMLLVSNSHKFHHPKLYRWWHKGRYPNLITLLIPRD